MLVSHLTFGEKRLVWKSLTIVRAADWIARTASVALGQWVDQGINLIVMIAEIRQAGISTLVVDRDYKKVLAHTDHAVVMEKGRLVVATNSAQLLAQPEKLAQLLGV